MGKSEFQPVFRGEGVGKKPKLGLPDSVQPGDWLTFIEDERYVTREVASTHSGYVLTAPLRSGYGTTVLDGPRKVKFTAFYEVIRPPAQVWGPAPEPHEEDEPEEVPALPTSVSPAPPDYPANPANRVRKAPKKCKKSGEPPPDWLNFLDPRYQDDE